MNTYCVQQNADYQCEGASLSVNALILHECAQKRAQINVQVW